MNFVLDKLSLKKELHPLRLPWTLAVLVGGTIGLKPLVQGSGMEGLLTGAAVYGFFGGLAMLAATAFGSDLQERTVGLLLSQPLSRLRLWAQKMITVTMAILVACLAESVLLAVVSSFYPDNEIGVTLRELLTGQSWMLAGMFLLASVCSCTFWTLVAGSTVGGLVFALAGQFFAALAAAFVIARIHREQELFENAQTFTAIVVGALVYSVVFCYLGWRKFVRFEVRAAGFGAGGAGASIFSWNGPWSRLLVSQPTTKILNLVRKELRLQKPTFQLAGAFLLGWLGILSLQLVRPAENITYLFEVITCLYAPICSLLIGCLSLGEERAMGITSAQLVLPISASLQWFIKLVVCVAATAVLSLALPFLVFWATGQVVDVSGSALVKHDDHGMQALAIISGLMFVLGFWAISLTTNTVEAALVAIAGIIILPICAAVGVKSAYSFVGVPAGAETAEGLMVVAGAAAVLLLVQSFIQFPRTGERKGKLLVYSIILVTTIFFGSFCSACFL